MSFDEDDSFANPLETFESEQRRGVVRKTKLKPLRRVKSRARRRKKRRTPVHSTNESVDSDSLQPALSVTPSESVQSLKSRGRGLTIEAPSHLSPPTFAPTFSDFSPTSSLERSRKPLSRKPQQTRRRKKKVVRKKRSRRHIPKREDARTPEKRKPDSPRGVLDKLPSPAHSDLREDDFSRPKPGDIIVPVPPLQQPPGDNLSEDENEESEPYIQQVEEEEVVDVEEEGERSHHVPRQVAPESIIQSGMLALPHAQTAPFEYESELVNPLSKSVADLSKSLQSIGRKTVNFLNTYSFQDPEKHPSGQGDDGTGANADDSVAHQVLKMFPGVQNPVLAVNVHETKFLENVLRPHVKVTFIDAKEKSLVRRANRSGSVSNQREYVDGNVGMAQEYVLAQTTHPYPMRKKRTTAPRWNESLYFNDIFSNLVRRDVFCVFEVMDVLPERQKVTHICWGSVDVSAACGHRVWLQLFKYPPVFYEKATRLKDKLRVGRGGRSRIPKTFRFPATAAYLLHSASPRKKFLSGLCVSLVPVERPVGEIRKFPFRTNSVFDSEEGSRAFNDIRLRRDKAHGGLLLKDGGGGMVDALSSDEDLARRKRELRARISRDPREVCKIPTSPLYQFESGPLGCLRVEFSPCGEYLACGCVGKRESFVKVFNAYLGVQLIRFDGHLNIIYDLEWSEDGQELASASQDGTARIWNISVKSVNRACLSTLYHPCFVYTIRFLSPRESDNRYYLTGGYDGVIRVFSPKNEKREYKLIQELTWHKSRVNSLVFDTLRTKLFVGAGSGAISIWSIDISEDNSISFERMREVREKHLTMSPLTVMRRHPRYNYLMFVHSQDNLIRCVDVNQRCKTIATFSGVKCYVNSQKMNISPDPDATFVVSGSSENGSLFVWDRMTETLTPSQDGVDIGFGMNNVYDVAWSSTDHVIACCSYGVAEPIRLLCHYKSSQSNISTQREEKKNTNLKKLLITSRLKGIFARRREEQKKKNDEK